MKAIAENIYTRGQHGIQYVRRRIPAAIRAAYPAKQRHIVRRQAGLEDAEFDELGAELAEQRAQLGRMLAQGKSQAAAKAPAVVRRG